PHHIAVPVYFSVDVRLGLVDGGNILYDHIHLVVLVKTTEMVRVPGIVDHDPVIRVYAIGRNTPGLENTGNPDYRSRDGGTVLPDLDRASDDKVEVACNGRPNEHIAAPDIRPLGYGEELGDVAWVKPIDRTATILVANRKLRTRTVDRHHIVLACRPLDIVECALINRTRNWCGPKTSAHFHHVRGEHNRIDICRELVFYRELQVGPQHPHGGDGNNADDNPDRGKK